MTTHKSWLVVAILVGVLASCSGTVLIDGPVLASPPPPLFGGGGLAALIRGTVAFDEDTGCLFLESDDGHRVPVVWPAGATWQDDPPAVQLQGQVIEPGTFVEGAGGFLQYQGVEKRAGTAVAEAARRCAGPTGEVAFFNQGSAISIVAD